MNRRRFLQDSGAMLALLHLGIGQANARIESLRRVGADRLTDFGLQLSTLNSVMATDFAGTLRKVAEIGYTQVEFSGGGFLGHSVSEVQDLLGELNLDAPLGRVALNLPPNVLELSDDERNAYFIEMSKPENFLRSLEDSLAAAKQLGQAALIMPAFTPNEFETMEKVHGVLEKMRLAGAMCAAEGVKFGYHNHDWEFNAVDGVVPMELMIEETDPDAVTFQLDAYWVTKAGVDLFGFLNRYAGRFSSCHMKDIDENGDFADVGDGLIDFPRFTREALATGAEYFFVERDNPPNPLLSAQRSYDYLKAMTF